MKRFDVNLPGRSYPIIIGNNALSEAAPLLGEHCKRAAVVSDKNVWELHGGHLENALQRAGIAYHTVVVPPGEGSKSHKTLERLYNEFFAFGLKRSDAVIAFGGGVVGDLAGFAAATYMRGVPYIQIPTTLLAQVDSSVGGKVAVNLEVGKNLVGSFYQPRLVLSDTGLLSTLPKREWNTGMAEVVKHAAIAGGELYELLQNVKELDLELLVYLNCKCKTGFVERDELDMSVRMMLNFGHTYGHALETLHSYKKYNHGEAVCIGMAMAARTGALLGLSAPDTEAKLLKLMDEHGLIYSHTDGIDDIIRLMTGDKKNSAGQITLVLLNSIGSPFEFRTTDKKLSALWGGRE